MINLSLVAYLDGLRLRPDSFLILLDFTYPKMALMLLWKLLNYLSKW